MHQSQLKIAAEKWGSIPLTGFQPRRPLNLSDKKADWKGALATLKRFAASSGYQRPLDLQAHAALENYWQWQSAAQEACHLLIYGIDLGLSGDQLRPIYQETVALWLDAAAVAAHARASMSQHSGEDFGVPPPITTEPKRPPKMRRTTGAATSTPKNRNMASSLKPMPWSRATPRCVGAGKASSAMRAPIWSSAALMPPA